MITKIHIKNFQVHRKKEIELDPYVTSIVGDSDKGKSSIIRSIRWVCLNQPSSEEFITHGKKFSKVVLEIDGREITRKRVKSKENSYHLDEKEYKAFGQGKVPDEVSNFLNISEINFQSQLENPFWFMNTGGEVSKELNKIVNLDLIDTTLGNISSEVKKAKGEVTFCQERLTSYLEKSAKIHWIEECVENLEQLTKLKEIKKSNDKKLYELESILTKIKEQTSILEYSKSSKEILTQLTDISGKFIQNLESLDKLHKYIELSKKAKKSNWNEAILEFREITDVKRNIDIHNTLVKNLEESLNHYKKIQEEVCQRKLLLTNLEKEIKEKMKGKCPVCGQIWNQECGKELEKTM